MTTPATTPFQYKHLSPEQVTATKANAKADAARAKKPSPPVVDNALKAAWEADHAAHAAKLEVETDEEQKEVHRKAMKTIEAALTAAG